MIEVNKELKREISGMTPSAMEKMVSFEWPGNVRQLENVLKRAMVLCQGEWITEDHLLFERIGERREAKEERAKKPMEELLDILFEELFKESSTRKDLDMISAVEKELIIRALRRTNGNQAQAAQLIGLNRSTLRGKMERYNIKKEVLVSKEE